SSLSTRCSGRAAQLTSTNGFPQRREFWWIAWATSSLPLPVSPTMSTAASCRATRVTIAISLRMTSLQTTALVPSTNCNSSAGFIENGLGLDRLPPKQAGPLELFNMFADDQVGYISLVFAIQ